MEGDDGDIDALIRSVTPDFRLSENQEEEVMRLAAVGLDARAIAVALELSSTDIERFCAAADTAGSDVRRAIDIGRVNGVASPLTKLQAAAEVGNVEAIRELDKIKTRSLYKNIIRNMDDDELSM